MKSKFDFDIIRPQTVSASWASTTPLSERKDKSLRVYKTSWILEGQDREGAFVYAMRRLFKALPAEVTPSRLIGLPDFGQRTLVRNEKTFEPQQKVALEQKPKKRYLTAQVMYDVSNKLSDAEGPRQLCSAIRDAIYGELPPVNSMGYVHREIRTGNIFIIEHPNMYTKGYLLSKDGKSVEGQSRLYTAYLYDLTVSKKLEGDNPIKEDTELFEFSVTTPTQFLKGRADMRHTPIHDLESFLWVTLSVAIEIIVDHVLGNKKVEIDFPDEEDDDMPHGEEDDAKVKTSTTSKYENAAEDNAENEVPMEVEDSTDSKAELSVEGEMIIATETNKTDEDAKMDTNDDDDAEAQKVEAVSDEKMDEDEWMTDEGEEVRKRKRSETITQEKQMSKKAKGKQKATAESDSKQEGGSHNDREGSGAPKTIEKDGADAKPKPAPSQSPNEPQYIAFENDKQTADLHDLLEQARTPETNPLTRNMLLNSLDDLLKEATNLAPFRPLLCALRALAAEYYAQCVSLYENDKNAEFSKDDIEEAFARYLDAFEKHMPTVDHWLYLKKA
ncbi:hypothetical protein EW145_g2845 [Phellinidium pouzarii]|uniref:Fungal-type protein kinase domain-containing protein n=1 Tax=Phellinidium pouzarii TaxID=167371 RepID=A0A4S4L9U2_9AGAM|nr:hypothetical protein EW145_g2845 [Phellinidium pouzarii]